MNFNLAALTRALIEKRGTAMLSFPELLRLQKLIAETDTEAKVIKMPYGPDRNLLYVYLEQSGQGHWWQDIACRLLREAGLGTDAVFSRNSEELFVDFPSIAGLSTRLKMSRRRECFALSSSDGSGEQRFDTIDQLVAEVARLYHEAKETKK